VHSGGIVGGIVAVDTEFLSHIGFHGLDMRLLDMRLLDMRLLDTIKF
jgi:hypothetical protein